MKCSASGRSASVFVQLIQRTAILAQIAILFGKLENSLPEACHEFQNTFCKLQSCKCSHRLASDDIACHTLCLYWPDRVVVCRPLTSFAPHHFSSKPIRFFYWIFCVFSIRQIILICLSAAAFRLTVSARRLGESVQIGSC